ncbi:MAG: hypothetical protein U5J64_06150 [Halobacteriales archaeon]|nr:hypothetical protein [Halobacteriales archaeon]
MTYPVEGTNPVIFHVSDAVDINSPDIDLEGDRADLLQVYSGHSGSINVEDFTGALYAPESDITVTSGSVLRGAAIGNNVVVSGDYYHDAALRRASLPDCIDPPLRNFNAVERRVSVR